MRKAALPAAVNRFRRRYHCCSSALPFPSAASRSPVLITSDILVYHGGAFGNVLPIPRYSLAFLPSYNHFLTSSHRSTSQDPRFTETDAEEEDSGVEWEEEEDREPFIGDGGDGGGIVLGDVKWGEHALSLAREVLLSRFGDDIALYAFKVSPKGYIYVRLDKLTTRFGCPCMEEMKDFNLLYKERLDKVGEAGAMPANMALEVSSPGVERLLRVPEDLNRFKDMAMQVRYVEEESLQQSERVLALESVNSEHCAFRLANVKENREGVGKGRPLSRKLRDWRLILPFKSILRINLYLDFRT